MKLIVGYRNQKSTSWDTFKKKLKDRMKKFKGCYGTREELEQTTKALQQALLKAYYNNCPEKVKTLRGSTP